MHIQHGLISRDHLANFLCFLHNFSFFSRISCHCFALFSPCRHILHGMCKISLRHAKQFCQICKIFCTLLCRTSIRIYYMHLYPKTQEKDETSNGFVLLKKEENRQFIRRKFSLHDSQCPTSYTCIRKTRAVPSFPARGLPQCCIRTTAAQFPNQSYPAVPVPARAESS